MNGWFVGLLVCWLVGLLVGWFVGLLVCWFVWFGWLVGLFGWLFGWVVGWLVGCLVGWLFVFLLVSWLWCCCVVVGWGIMDVQSYVTIAVS